MGAFLIFPGKTAIEKSLAVGRHRPVRIRRRRHALPCAVTNLNNKSLDRRPASTTAAFIAGRTLDMTTPCGQLLYNAGSAAPRADRGAERRRWPLLITWPSARVAWPRLARSAFRPPVVPRWAANEQDERRLPLLVGAGDLRCCCPRVRCRRRSRRFRCAG